MYGTFGNLLRCHKWASNDMFLRPGPRTGISERMWSIANLHRKIFAGYRNTCLWYRWAVSRAGGGFSKDQKKASSYKIVENLQWPLKRHQICRRQRSLVTQQRTTLFSVLSPHSKLKAKNNWPFRMMNGAAFLKTDLALIISVLSAVTAQNFWQGSPHHWE